MINLQSKAWRSTIAAALLFLEGLVSLSLALYLVIQNFIADNVSDRHALLGEIIYALIGSAVLILLAWGFFTNRRFSRAPSVLLNLIFIGISTYMFNEGLLVLGFAAVSVIPE
jgi:hypothetical protein